MKLSDFYEMTRELDPETEIKDLIRGNNDDEEEDSFCPRGICWYPSEGEHGSIYLSGQCTPIRGLVNMEDDVLVNKLYSRGISE